MKTMGVCAFAVARRSGHWSARRLQMYFHETHGSPADTPMAARGARSPSPSDPGSARGPGTGRRAPRGCGAPGRTTCGAPASPGWSSCLRRRTCLRRPRARACGFSLSCAWASSRRCARRGAFECMVGLGLGLHARRLLHQLRHCIGSGSGRLGLSASTYSILPYPHARTSCV